MFQILMDEETATGWGGMAGMLVWLVIIILFFYFIMIRPNNKEKKNKEIMMKDLAVGDTVMTTSGFYGTIIDVEEDTIIVEFGNNRNCRIPMQKAAIADVEKPEESVQEKPAEPEKKSLFSRKDKNDDKSGDKANDKAGDKSNDKSSSKERK